MSNAEFIAPKKPDGKHYKNKILHDFFSGWQLEKSWVSYIRKKSREHPEKKIWVK